MLWVQPLRNLIKVEYEIFVRPKTAFSISEYRTSNPAP
jgi:hypothetical protein